MKTNTKKIVGLGVLTAIVVVMQFFAAQIKLGPFSITLCLAPIVVGAALYGKWSGAWLGAVFGLTVLLSGDAGAFLAINPAGTVVTVLLKGLLAGLIGGLVYSLIEKKSKIGAVITAGIVTPVVNTGVFLIGCLLFFMDTIEGWAAAAGMESVGTYMITGLVGLNFVVELAVNLVLATAIERIIRIGQKTIKEK